MEKIISNKAASFVSMELARYALERADLRASSILTAIATTLGVTRAWDKNEGVSQATPSLCLFLPKSRS